MSESFTPEQIARHTEALLGEQAVKRRLARRANGKPFSEAPFTGADAVKETHIVGGIFARNNFESYADHLFEAADEAGEIPKAYEGIDFSTAEESVQEEILFKIHDLVARLKDYTRTVRAFSEQEEGDREVQAPATVTVRINGHFVRVAPKGGKLQERIAKRSVAKERSLKEIDRLKKDLANLGAIPGVREAYTKKLTKYFFVMKAGRMQEEARQRVAEIDASLQALHERATEGPAGTLIGAELEEERVLREERAKQEKAIQAFENSPGGREYMRLREVSDYAHAYAKGRMIEVPSVRALVNEGLGYMRSHQPFLLAGHLGSGKTENAKHMARLFMMENGVGFDPKQSPDAWYDALEPEIFSGSEGASVYDLVGKLKLVGRAAEGSAEIAKRIQEMRTGLEKAGIRDVPEAEIGKIVLGKGDVTQTIFNYGPFGRALKRGVPIIIDEVNRMPPEVTSRLNDVMLRRAGSKVRLQENGEEEMEVPQGFAVLGTCNLGAQYAGLQEVDAAFKSRWIAREVFYPTVGETYDLMLGAILRKDRPRFPSHFPEKGVDLLIDLAVVTREIQEIFSGRTEAQSYMSMATSATPNKSQLEKAVVSTRDLMRKIIKPWKDSGFAFSLDDIIAKNILGAEVFSLDDQKLMTELFVRRGFLQGWDVQRLEQAGIRSVSQQEMNALQVQMQTPAYREDPLNIASDALRVVGHEHASLARSEMTIGAGRVS